MYYSNDVSVDILVNGNSTAKYYKDGKVYVEAKDGSEYEILIKNNGFNKVLAVSSVDGLNVLNGEPSGEVDSGYIINGYNSYRIKGFRYSDEKVGAFKFSKKENSYASSKSVELTINCGVIGVRIYNENVNYTLTANSTNSPTWISATYGTCIDDVTGPDLNSVFRASTGGDSNTKSLSFDMGSTWGQSKESKVTSSDFDRGNVFRPFDIYYASRASLVEMGVIQASKPQVSFPNSFPKYATPPKGWKE